MTSKTAKIITSVITIATLPGVEAATGTAAVAGQVVAGFDWHSGNFFISEHATSVSLTGVPQGWSQKFSTEDGKFIYTVSSPDSSITVTYTFKPVAMGWNADRSRWYDNGVMARNHAFYDPESDAWYWADADGSIAAGKDVFIPRDESDRSKGGKWVRFREDQTMVKGEDFKDNTWYYFLPSTGAMQKGNVYMPEWNAWHRFGPHHRTKLKIKHIAQCGVPSKEWHTAFLLIVACLRHHGKF